MLNSSEQNKITEILQDLYTLDPEFKQHEPKLRELITALLMSEPDTHFDTDFAQRLRSELVSTPKIQKSFISPYNPLLMNRMTYGITGGIITLMLIVPLAFLASRKTTILDPLLNRSEVKDASVKVGLKPQISEKGRSAFGPLALATSVKISNASSSAVSDTGTLAMTKTSATANQAASSSAPLAVIPTPTPEPTMAMTMSVQADPANTSNTRKIGVPVKYEYDGAELKLTESQGIVLKRTMGEESSKQLSDLVKIDLSESKKAGYVISINAEEGLISINKTEQKWVKQESTPATTNISKTVQPPALEDDVLISITNAFIKDHGIDTSTYSAPIVQTGSTTVLYPINLNSKEVYDLDGTRYGMHISVDTTEKKVQSVKNITSQIYESSKYPLETDSEKIISVITSLDTPIKKGSAVSAKKVLLDTPKNIFMRYWSYDEETGTTTELYVPSLLFPIKNPEKSAQRPQFVLIPLVKDFLAKGKGNAFVPESMLASPESALDNKPEL